jgi:gluconokinase
VAGPILALDLGSSSVRALIFDEHAIPVAGALGRRLQHFTTDPSGQASFMVDDYLAALADCLDELQAGGHLDGVTEVAIDSQWHSVAAVDHAGRPASELLTWADTRARPAPPWARPDEAQTERLRQRTGCVPHTMYWTLKVPWLAQRGLTTHRFLGLPELLGHQFLGDDTMSLSMASATGLLDVGRSTWDEEALDLAGLAPSSLPALAESTWRGRLRPDYQRRWPALARAAWHPAVGDGAAANVGVGCVDASRIAVTVGTSAAIRQVSAGDPSHSLGPGLWRYRVDQDRVVSGAAFASGGQLYAWTRQLLGLSDDPPAPAGSRGVTVIGWQAGTRPPAPAVGAGHGTVLGLSLAHTPADLISATVESVCFELASGLDALLAASAGPVEVVANGGAIEHSDLFRRRLAAALGRPLHLSTLSETTARGAALLALGRAGHVGPEEPGPVIEPDPADVDALVATRQRWDEGRRMLLGATESTRSA